MKKIIYVLDSKIRWKDFKELQKSVRDDGPTPVHGDKILWHLLRENKIYCGFRDDLPDDMWIGLSLPSNRTIKVIKSKNVSPKNEKETQKET